MRYAVIAEGRCALTETVWTAEEGALIAQMAATTTVSDMTITEINMVIRETMTNDTLPQSHSLRLHLHPMRTQLVSAQTSGEMREMQKPIMEFEEGPES